MEEAQDFKHACKFCSKSFPCGRSLGGHMRSHMINDISAQSDGTKLTKKKLPSLPTLKSTTSETNNCYGLRENPKKTWRIGEDDNTNSSLLDKSCKDCGKIFQSWKALFGHMKCHSEKVISNNNNNSFEEEEQQDSWTSKMVLDGQSDTETAAPRRRKRSKRRVRYMGTAANSSSLSYANNNNNTTSSSVSEIEQEQEEVAMCLIMLSRDVGQRTTALNSVAESSDNNSVFLDTDKVNSKTEGKNSACGNGSKAVKVEKFNVKKVEVGKLESEDGRSEGRKTEFSVSRKEFSKNDEFEKSGAELSSSLAKDSNLGQAEMVLNKCNKRKALDSFDTEPIRSESRAALDSEASKKAEKSSISSSSSKFECTTCNKVFHSYQALGGHRASHKKIKGCFASRIDSSESSIEATEQHSPDPPASDSTKLLKPIINNEASTNRAAAIHCDNRVAAETKKNKGHECPICLKVFPSGQALGGHKRSHLVSGGQDAKTNQTTTIQEQVPAIRDFLDLNLPAPVEEDSNGVVVGFGPWWTGSNHKHEALVGLISN